MSPTDPPAGPRFEKRARIRFGHCDPAGIVFYPQYFVLFNGLLEDWFTEALGFPYAELIERRRIGTPTVKIESTFTAVSRLGDEVVLGLAVLRLGRASFTLGLDCRGVDEPIGSSRVQVRQVIVTTDLDTHRAVEMAFDVRAAVARFFDAR